MAITLKINSIDRTNKVDWQSISLRQVLTKQPDELTFLIKFFGAKNYRPNLGEEVELYDGATKLFGGVLVELHEEIDGLAQYLNCVCKDYTEILDGQLVAKIYEQKTVTYIINDLLNTFATGLGFTNFNGVSPIIVDKIVFNYLPISKALEKMADYLQNFDWYVDENKDIHFYNTVLVPAPFSLNDTNGNYIFNSLKIKNESHQIRNEIYVRGGEIRSSSTRTDLFDGDGVKTIFVLGNKFPVKPNVFVNAVAQNVGIDYQDADAGFNCMWDFNRRTLRFTAGNIPPAGVNNIEATEYPLFPLIFRKRDEVSILNYGLKQQLIVDKTIATINSASQRSDKELDKFSTPAQIGSFATYRNGLRAGQIIHIDSPIRNNLNKDFKITEVSAKLHTQDSFVYEVNILASEDIGINDVLTDLLVTYPAQDFDGGNEFVQRYVNFEEDMDITDTLYAPTISNPPYFWSPSGNDLIWTFGTWS